MKLNYSYNINIIIYIIIFIIKQYQISLIEKINLQLNSNTTNLLFLLNTL
jgi:hypothetical protein